MPKRKLGDTTFLGAVARIIKPSSFERKMADLFCGTGETTIAARAEGLEVVYAEDPDSTMRDIYASNAGLVASEPQEVIDFDKIPDFGLLISQVPDDLALERVLRFLRVRRPSLFLLVGDLGLNNEWFIRKVLDWTERLGYRIRSTEGGQFFLVGYREPVSPTPAVTVTVANEDTEAMPEIQAIIRQVVRGLR